MNPIPSPQDWPVLRRIASVYRWEGNVILLLGGVFDLALLLEWMGSFQQNNSAIAGVLGSFPILLIVIVIIALIAGAIANGFFAKSESILLFIAIEANTRATAQNANHIMAPSITTISASAHLEDVPTQVASSPDAPTSTVTPLWPTPPPE